MDDVVIHEKGKQEKTQGELGVLALINKLLNLIGHSHALSTIYLALSGNLGILFFFVIFRSQILLFRFLLKFDFYLTFCN